MRYLGLGLFLPAIPASARPRGRAALQEQRQVAGASLPHATEVA